MEKVRNIHEFNKQKGGLFRTVVLRRGSLRVVDKEGEFSRGWEGGTHKEERG